MRNTHGWRILEERKDYILYYTQYCSLDLNINPYWGIHLELEDLLNNIHYYKNFIYDSKIVLTTQNELEKVLKRGVKTLLKRMKKGKK